MDIQKAAISAEMPDATVNTGSRVEDVTTWKPLERSLEDELNEAGDEATSALREKQRAMIDSLDLKK